MKTLLKIGVVSVLILSLSSCATYTPDRAYVQAGVSVGNYRPYGYYRPMIRVMPRPLVVVKPMPYRYSWHGGRRY